MPQAAAKATSEKLREIRIRLGPEEARSLVSVLDTPSASSTGNLVYLNERANLGRIGHRTTIQTEQGPLKGASISLISPESPEIRATFNVNRDGKARYVPGGLGIINRHGVIPKMLWDVPEGRGSTVRIHYEPKSQPAHEHSASVLLP